MYPKPKTRLTKFWQWNFIQLPQVGSSLPILEQM